MHHAFVLMSVSYIFTDKICFAWQWSCTNNFRIWKCSNLVAAWKKSDWCCRDICIQPCWDEWTLCELYGQHIILFWSSYSTTLKRIWHVIYTHFCCEHFWIAFYLSKTLLCCSPVTGSSDTVHRQLAVLRLFPFLFDFVVHKWRRPW